MPPNRPEPAHEPAHFVQKPSEAPSVTRYPVEGCAIGAPDGGGGSRTRVRKWILQSLYVRSVTQYFARGGERATGPQASYLNISSLTGAAPARDQPDSSTSRRPASGRQIRKRTTNRSYAANASSLLAIKVFQGVLRGPRNLGTLLHIHQTRRSRDAPDVLPAYGRPTCNISLMD